MTTSEKPRRKRAVVAVIAAVAIAGVGAGRVTAPFALASSDPLGGWHYAELPIRVSLAGDGGAARAYVRPEIITRDGRRVTVPEFRGIDASWLECRASLTSEPTRHAEEISFTRSPGGAELEIEGRLHGVVPWPDCVLTIFRAVVADNPLP